MFICDKRPGNHGYHWEEPGIGVVGVVRGDGPGKLSLYLYRVNMSISYKLAGELLSAKDGQGQPWLDLVGVVADSPLKRLPGQHGLYGHVSLSIGPRFCLETSRLSPS